MAKDIAIPIRSVPLRPIPPRSCLAAAAVAVALLPAVTVSMLAETQFAEALPTGIVVVMAMIAFAVLVRRNAMLRTDRWVATLVFAVFALRLSVTLGIGRWWWWPQALMAASNDWDVYEKLGWDLAQSGLSMEALTRYPLNEVGVVYVVGVLYSVVGRNPLVLTIAFTFLAAWIALALGDLVALAAGSKAGRHAAILASVMPASVLFGSMPTKDILVALCFVKVIVMALRMRRELHGWSAWAVAKAVALVGLIAMLRATAVAILLLSILGILAFGKRRRRAGLIVFAMVLALAGYGALAWRQTRLEREISLGPMTVSQYVDDRTGRNDATPSEAGLTFSTDEASSISLRTYWDGQFSRAYLIPLRAGLLMFAPFPPADFRTLDVTLGSLNTVFMLLLLPATWGAIAHREGGWRTSLSQLSWLWVPMATHLLALAAALPFIITRHSLLAQFLFVGLAAAGMRRDHRLLALYLLLPVFVALLVLVYMVVKGH